MDNHTVPGNERDTAIEPVHTHHVITKAIVLMAEHILSSAHVGNKVHKPLSKLLTELKQVQAWAVEDYDYVKKLYTDIEEQPPVQEASTAAKEETHTDAKLPCALKELDTTAPASEAHVISDESGHDDEQHEAGTHKTDE